MCNSHLDQCFTACDLLQNEADAYRKIRLRVEDVQGRNCLTNFWVWGNYSGTCLPFSKHNAECTAVP